MSINKFLLLSVYFTYFYITPFAFGMEGWVLSEEQIKKIDLSYQINENFNVDEMFNDILGILENGSLKMLKDKLDLIDEKNLLQLFRTVSKQEIIYEDDEYEISIGPTETLLMFAAQKITDPKKFEELLNILKELNVLKEALTFQIDDKSPSIFMSAIRFGNLPVIRLLAQEIKDLHLFDEEYQKEHDGHTVMHLAVSTHDLEIVTYLVSQYSKDSFIELISSKDAEERTFLEYCHMQKDLPIYEHIMESWSKYLQF